MIARADKLNEVSESSSSGVTRVRVSKRIVQLNKEMIARLMIHGLRVNPINVNVRPLFRLDGNPSQSQNVVI